MCVCVCVRVGGGRRLAGSDRGSAQGGCSLIMRHSLVCCTWRSVSARCMGSVHSEGGLLPLLNSGHMSVKATCSSRAIFFCRGGGGGGGRGLCIYYCQWRIVTTKSCWQSGACGAFKGSLLFPHSAPASCWSVLQCAAGALCCCCSTATAQATPAPHLNHLGGLFAAAAGAGAASAPPTAAAAAAAAATHQQANSINSVCIWL